MSSVVLEGYFVLVWRCVCLSDRIFSEGNYRIVQLEPGTVRISWLL